jgi:precorrin-3B synthase
MNALRRSIEATALRRGACPGLSSPVETGDGLLARLTPSGSTIALDAFIGLCAAARRHGNGIVEITSRGSIQIRGLTAETAPLFAADVAELRIEGSDGIPVLTDPLTFDDLAVQLRNALAGTDLAAHLSAIVSVVVDLDGFAADILLRTVNPTSLHVALGGDAATASSLGAVPLGRGADCAVRLFTLLAALSPRSKMRDAVARGGLLAFKMAIADLLIDEPAPPRQPPFEPIGIHQHSSGNILGIGLPFGHSDSERLSGLVESARRSEASGVRTSPGRALLLMGLPSDATAALVAEAATFGFIVDPRDPCRRVMACAGAPFCSSGQIATRAMALTIADAARALPAGEIVHLSGCAKGCAHPAPAPLAVFGRDRRCDVFVDGEPYNSIMPDELPDTLAKLARFRGSRR